MKGFAEAVERYRPELLVHCYRLLGSYDDAEEMVQETFLRAWRAREGFEGRSSLRAWLYRIATNVCIDDVRRPRGGCKGKNCGKGGGKDGGRKMHHPEVPARRGDQENTRTD